MTQQVVRNEVPKSDFLMFLGVWVQGVSRGSQGPFQGAKSEAKGAKIESHSHPTLIKIDKNEFRLVRVRII